MTRALSMAIRERAMARLHAGETVRAVAEALSVAPSSVVKWSQRRRATGSAAPGKIGGYVPRQGGGSAPSPRFARHAVTSRCRGRRVRHPLPRAPGKATSPLTAGALQGQRMVFAMALRWVTSARAGHSNSG